MSKKVIITALTVLYLLQTFYSNSYAEESNADAQTVSQDAAENAGAISERPSPPEILSEAVTLMDAATGIVLFQQAQDEENYPASITKIMTALIALEQCEDLNERITFSRQAVYSLPRDASHIAMDEDETLTVYEALHGLLLASANEVANALAEHIAGSVDDFAVLMNKRAAALGAKNTHFVNPSGLFDENHTTTAHDMALIMREAATHPEFREIIATRRFDIPPTEKQPEVRELLNSNRLIQPGEFFNETVVGGKTGYTDEAMHTLVNYAEKDGRSLVVSVMHGEKDGTVTDTNALLEYGFSLPYPERIVFNSGEFLRTVPVYSEGDGKKIKIGDAAVKAEEDLSYALPEVFDVSEVRYDLDLSSELTAPVAAGDVTGKVSCYIQDVKIGEVQLKALNAVYAPAVLASGQSGDQEEDGTVSVMANGAKAVTGNGNSNGAADSGNGNESSNGAAGSGNGNESSNGAAGSANENGNSNGAAGSANENANGAADSNNKTAAGSAVGNLKPADANALNNTGNTQNSAAEQNNSPAQSPANPSSPVNRSASAASGDLSDPMNELFPFAGDDYLAMLAVPAGLSLLMILVSLFAYLRKRKKRHAKVLSFDRYAKYEDGNIYRYK